MQPLGGDSMAFLSGNGALSVISWITGRASLVVDLPRNCLESFYRKACDLEKLRQANEIIVFGWTITLNDDGTALAENNLTGGMIELDAEQVAEIKWAVTGPATSMN
jgi:hypothetical protein